MSNTWPGWETVRLIGKGSFGSVYEIQKEQEDQVYKSALKVISIPSDESEYKAIESMGMDKISTRNYFYQNVENVKQEFILMSQLKSVPNVVTIDDLLVEERENAFGWDILIKMELLNPLLEYIKEKPLTVEEICKLGMDMSKALEACHSNKIIHRDIKPGNIFVNRYGDFKLGDFGIARTISKTHGTLSHKGTYNYMAPEVYLGKKYDYTADIYSLGMVLYRLLNNNRLPFLPEIVIASSFEDAMARRMRGEQVPQIKKIDSRLSNIVLKCLDYVPENRFGSASELREALEMYLISVQSEEGTEEKEIPQEETSKEKQDPENKTIVLDESAEESTIVLNSNKKESLAQETPPSTNSEKKKNKRKVKKSLKKRIIAGVIILFVTIGAVGAFSLNMGFIKINPYIQAMVYMKEEKYENAIETFEKLQPKRDCSKEIKKCLKSYYQYGLKMHSKGKYAKAVTIFTYLENRNYKDSKDKLIDSKYMYCRQHAQDDNKKTYKYLKELKALDYKESKALYNKLYSWKAEAYFVNSNGDEVSSLKVNQYFEVHFNIKGGPLKDDASLFIQTKAKYSNGYEGPREDFIVNGTEVAFHRGNDSYYTYWNAGIASPSTLTIEIYNKETGNKIGEGSIQVK